MSKLNLTLLFIGFTVLLIGQKTHNAENTFVKHLGHIESFKDLVHRPILNPEKRQERKNNMPPYMLNFKDKGSFVGEKVKGLPRGQDPLLNLNQRSGDVVVEPLLVIEGSDENQAFAGVPDVNGDIGLDHYVETVNGTLITIYNRDGNLIHTQTANSFWTQFGVTSGGDPIILFDEIEERWVLTEFPGFGQGNALLVAVSETADPLGAWNGFMFQTPRFPDYPKYGIWGDGIYVTTNEGGPIPIYAINKNDLYANADLVRVQRLTVPRLNPGPGFQVLTPVDADGLDLPQDGPAIVTRINDDIWGNVGQDAVDVIEVSIDWDISANSFFEIKNITVSPYDSETCSQPGPNFGCLPQPNGVSIDGQPQIIMNRPNYRNFGTHESIVLNFMVDAFGNDIAGIRWMELRRTGGEWGLHQEGTEAGDDGHSRFMGGIAINSKGSIGLAYNIASSTKEPSLAFTGRLASDPLGEMTVKEYEFATGVGSNDYGRFGDYPSMSTDPVTDDFWYVGEYIKSTGGGTWGTKIVSFAPKRDSIDLTVDQFSGVSSGTFLGDAETISINVRNAGLTDQANFKVGLILDNVVIEESDISLDSFPSDSNYMHTFANTVDLSVIKDYQFQTYVHLASDERTTNDTLQTLIKHLPTLDLSIVSATGTSFSCENTNRIRLEVINLGATSATSADIIYQLNDGPEQIKTWNGFAATNRFFLSFIDLVDIPNGENVLKIRLENLNGGMDQVPSNDSTEFVFNIDTEAEDYRLELLTDRFPEETSWELQSDDGQVLYAGGPYAEDQDRTVIMDTFCLGEGLCYKFVLFDSAGDGIRWLTIEGDYHIFDMDGNVIDSLADPDFGSVDVNEFCLVTCNASFDTEIAHATTDSSNDGSITILATAVGTDLLYSIDGGNNFSSENIFNNLSIGEYEVVVDNQMGCVYSQTVSVLNQLVSTEDLSFGKALEIYPNPSDGLFKILLHGIEDVQFLPFHIMDLNGKVLLRQDLASYDGVLQTELYLFNLADGTYFLQIEHKGKKEIRKLIKQ